MGDVSEDEHMEIEVKQKDQFILHKCNIVLFWSWDIIADNCAICRNSLILQCIECQANDDIEFDIDDKTGVTSCVMVKGVCNHAFHLHCISKWLSERNVCPLDNKEWIFD